MFDTVKWTLEKFGFPTLAALGLGYFLDRAMTAASEERAIVVDQIADLREKVERCVK